MASPAGEECCRAGNVRNVISVRERESGGRRGMDSHKFDKEDSAQKTILGGSGTHCSSTLPPSR